MTTPTDPLFGSQWHFPLLGDIETIWDEYTGVGVNVAVYDDGVDYTHEDLAGNYDASLHFVYNGITYDPTPISSSNAHGTAVSGLIGAVGNNGVGGSGVAFGATLTGVNYLADIQYLSSAIEEAAMHHAANFDIMNNSWGQTPVWASYQNLTTNSGAAAFFDQSDYITTNGRGGLGTNIIHAAGNDDMNANGSGTNASRFTTTIAATDSSGDATWYTNWGSSILITAPAGAVTTDITGTDGYTTGNYTTTFGGTSAATPVTSGVVALMLEANAGLGWRDVQNILATSAGLTGSAIGTSGSGEEQGGWFTNGASNWNGGGHSMHLSYGFGMLDAYAAVRMAEVWTVMYGDAATSANEQEITASSGAVNLTISNSSTVNSVINITNDMTVEDISVTVSLQHDWAADVDMYLVSPDGTRYLLMADEGGSTLMDGGFTWTFGITGALDMSSLGAWTLEIADDFSLDDGTLYNWEINFYGSAASTNDVYHFTDDFLTMVAYDSSRGTIDDTNGGIDWLNFAAISGALVIDLGGGLFSVAGVNWGTLVDDWNNIAAGDGSDVITGNGLSNTMLGQRGDDSLYGNAGDDSLSGGAGNDYISGGTQNDKISGGDGVNTLYGNSGDDTFYGGAGTDAFFGGTGVDTVVYTDSASRVVLNLRNNTGTDGDALGDTFSSIEDVVGSNFNDVIYGTDDTNVLFGGAGRDLLRGNGGDDFLFGGSGKDDLNGGSGFDVAAYDDALTGVTVDLSNLANNTGDAKGDTYTSIEGFYGSRFNDTMIGDSNANTFGGNLGDDTLYGGDGDDYFAGGGGADSFYGGADTDTVSYELVYTGGITIDMVYGGLGTGEALGDVFFDIEMVIGTAFGDTMFGTVEENTLFGSGGSDSIFADAGNDVLFGGDADDTIRGSLGDDVLFGGSGADTLDGGDDIDTASYADSAGRVNVNLNTGVGTLNDAAGDTYVSIENLIGSDYNDYLHGDIENNTIYGGADDDLLRGYSGEDVLFGGSGADNLHGGAGVDTASYAGASSRIAVNLNTNTGTAGDSTGDTFTSIENIVGTDHNDYIHGGAGVNTIDGGIGNDVLRGYAGYDQIIGGEGADNIHGGAGYDTSVYTGSDAGVAVDLLAGTATGGHAQGDVLTSIENLTGSAFNDTLSGTNSRNTLNGGEGNDTINGNGGHDSIIGGAGDDELTGGTGRDTFVFADGFGNDTVTDFSISATNERIDLAAVTSITNYADLVANHMTQVGSDTVIDDLNGNTITLTGITLTDLTSDEFNFV